MTHVWTSGNSRYKQVKQIKQLLSMNTHEHHAGVEESDRPPERTTTLTCQLLQT